MNYHQFDILNTAIEKAVRPATIAGLTLLFSTFLVLNPLNAIFYAAPKRLSHAKSVPCAKQGGGGHFFFLFRALILNQIGEPINPKLSRIWFARNRSKLKCSFTSLSVNSTNVGGATAACVM